MAVSSPESSSLSMIEATRAAAQESLSLGLEMLPVPERIRDIIGRQLDRLDERSRELVARSKPQPLGLARPQPTPTVGG
jgi:hypothetical protein